MHVAFILRAVIIRPGHVIQCYVHVIQHDTHAQSAVM